jgi:hypothetical protein
MIQGNAYEPSPLMNHYGLEIRISQMPIKDTKSSNYKSAKTVENDHERVTTLQIVSKNTEIL